MQRAAQLGVGVVLGALALGVGPWSVALGGLAVVVLGIALRSAGPPGAVPAPTPARASNGCGLRLVPFGLGLLLIGARGVAAPEAGHSPELPAGRGPWIAVVESVGAPRTGSRPAILQLESPAALRVAATLPWYPVVGPSDRVSISGRIRPPPEGPYGEYLARIGVAGTILADTTTLLPAEAGPGRVLEDLRRTAAEAITRAVPEPEAGLAAGVLIGLRDRVDRTLAADFTTAGASHVVAISGWNIAIVASTLAAVAGGLQRRRRALLTALAIAGYVAFVGPSASVVRAAAMAGVALLSRELGRPGTAAAALGWAVTTLLVVDPAWVDDAGFRLSALATAGIIGWGSGMTRALAGSAPGRPRRWLAEILGVSLAAQAATLPIVLLEFGRLSLVAPLVNVVVVPLVPPAMAAGVVALGGGLATLGGLPSAIATVAGLPAWAFYGAIVAAVRAGAGMPLASLELDAPWDGVAAVVAAVLVFAGARLASGRTSAGRRAPEPIPRPTAPAKTRGVSRAPGSGAMRLAAATLAVSIAGLGLAIAHRPDGVARLTVIDVGQGDAILVEGGDGGRLLVDGGPDPGRLLVALDERLPPWDRRIDAVILTHPHEDHVGGLVLLLERYRVERVYEPGMIGPGAGYAAWEAWFESAVRRPSRKALATGDRLAVDDVRLRVLWPDAGRVPERPADGGTAVNNVSIVLLGEVGGQRFLLTGDVEQGVDPELVARGLPRLDVLKVAHHGSRTASTEAFLEAVRPRVAIVSAGRDNPYGHPTPATLERLSAFAGRTYRTDLDGSVEVGLDGATVRVTTAARSPRPGVAIAPGAGADAAAAAFRCGIPSQPGDDRSATPAGDRGPIAAATTRLPRPAPGSVEGRRSGLRYHRSDGERIEVGDWSTGPLVQRAVGFSRRGGQAAGPPRLPVGRRRLRPRRGRGRAPPRPGPLSGRPAGSLATVRRARRPRPPPGRDHRAPRDQLDVRGRLARRRHRGRSARPA